MAESISKISLGEIDSIEFAPANVAFDEWHYPNIITTVGNERFIREMLINEQLHVAPINSLEFLKSDLFSCLKSACVSYRDASQKIFLFSKKPLKELSNTTIAVPKGFECETALLKILLKQNNVDINTCRLNTYGKNEDMNIMSLRYEAVLSCEKTIFTKPAYKFDYIYDLAQEWKNLTSLPFVHYIWASWSDLEIHCKTTFEWVEELIGKAVDINSDIYLNKTIAFLHKKFKVEKELLTEYYKTCIDYNFGEQQQESLKKFKELYERENT